MNNKPEDSKRKQINDTLVKVSKIYEGNQPHKKGNKKPPNIGTSVSTGSKKEGSEQ